MLLGDFVVVVGLVLDAASCLGVTWLLCWDCLFGLFIGSVWLYLIVLGVV